MDGTILLKNLNENPYEPECLEANKFHAAFSGDKAQRGRYKIMGQKFKLFYDPMWNLFGDFKSSPGTYYYSGSNPYIYDQVTIRPNIRERFRDND